jgi:hypothetical protein
MTLKKDLFSEGIPKIKKSEKIITYESSTTTACIVPASVDLCFVFLRKFRCVVLG